MKAINEKGDSAPLKVGDQIFNILPEWVEIKKEMRKVNGKNFIPAVIEPSFGIGRMLYCMFEHCYYIREGDDRRTVFKFTPIAAPIKTTIFPLLAKQELIDKAEEIARDLRAAGLSNTVDSTGTTIGRRYSRTDEIGVPFAITVDFDTLKDGSITIRDRDTTAQIRVPREDIVSTLRGLAEMDTTWEHVSSKYPAQDPPSEN